MGEIDRQQHDEARKRRAERAHAGPFIRRWLGETAALVAAKRLGEIHLRVANKLANYPSANVGKCWAGNKRLASDLGRSARTIWQVIKDLQCEGLLISKRGAPGKSATKWFAIGGERLFETPPQNVDERGQVIDFPGRRPRAAKVQDSQRSASLDSQVSASLDSQRSANLDSQVSASKPSEQNPYEQDHPPQLPLSPTCENAKATDRSGNGILSSHHARGETARSLATKEVETVLDGEIVHPISFSDFWNGSRRHSDNKDKPGPARRAFEALSEEERQEITVLLDRDGEIDLGGEWTCVWLKARAWREASLRKSGVAGVLDDLRRPRPGSREDRQEQTTLARRRFREWVHSQDADVAARRDEQRELEQYPVIEHTRAFDEWCQHYRRNHRVPPLAMDIVGQDGRRCRGFYMSTPFPPSDDGGSA